MLIVKDKKGFAIQGTKRPHSFKQGAIVADEIFEKEFPGDTGKKLRDIYIKEGILEVKKDKDGKKAKSLKEMSKDELIAHADKNGIEINENETEAVIVEAIEAAIANPPINLNKMNKAGLIEYAKSKEIEIDESATNAVIIEAIEAAAEGN